MDLLNALESPAKERSKASECHRKASFRRPSSPQQKTQGQLWSLEGADVAAVGRGRAPGSAARLRQRGGGEGAVPHARGQSVSRSVVRAFSRFHISLRYMKKPSKDLFICAAAEMRKGGDAPRARTCTAAGNN